MGLGTSERQRQGQSKGTPSKEKQHGWGRGGRRKKQVKDGFLPLNLETCLIIRVTDEANAAGRYRFHLSAGRPRCLHESTRGISAFVEIDVLTVSGGNSATISDF